MAPKSTRARGEASQYDPLQGLTNEEKKKYKLLEAKKEFLPNKIPHNPNLTTLGIKDAIDAHLSNLNWHTFVYPTMKGYKELSLQFLSTFQIQKKASSTYGHYGITFKFFGQEYGLRQEEVASIFGFQTEGMDHYSRMDSTFSDFWRQISIEPQHDKSSNAKHLISLTHFVLHRIITYTIFARGDGNEKVSQQDLFFLYGLILGKPIQTTKYFLETLAHMAKDPRGKFFLTSHISMIAKHVGALTPQRQTLLNSFTTYNINSNWLDISYLCAAKAIIPKNDDSYEPIIGERGVQLEEERRQRKRPRVPIREVGESSQPPQPSTSKRQSHPPPTQMDNIEKMLGKLVKKMAFLSHIHQDITQLQEKAGLPPCDHIDWTTSEEEDQSE